MPITVTPLAGGSGKPDPGLLENSKHAPGTRVSVPVPERAAVPPERLTPKLFPVEPVLQICRYLRLYAWAPSVTVVPRVCELPEREGMEQSTKVGFAPAV